MNYPYQPYPTQPPVPVCYRHPDRPTYIGCSRCGRPVCGECMRSAPVGQQCMDCVQTAAATTPPIVRPLARTSATPVVTYALIALNVAVFVMQMGSRGLQTKLALLPPAVAGGDYYRLVTSAFLHYGILHLAFNMYALYVLGPPLEQHLGRWRFAALYGLSALGGSVAVYLLSPLGAATVGASGAIYGLFGATLVAARRLELDMRWLVGLIAINLVITFAIPGISWQGHIGGLVTGAVVTAAYVYPSRGQRTLIQYGTTFGLLVLFAALVASRTAQLVG